VHGDELGHKVMANGQKIVVMLGQRDEYTG
jgi:hypothetical protein